MATTPTMTAIANQLDSRAATLALARIIATLGASPDWNADTMMAICDVISPVHAASGLPTFADADHRARRLLAPHCRRRQLTVTPHIVSGEPTPLPRHDGTPTGDTCPHRRRRPERSMRSDLRPH